MATTKKTTKPAEPKEEAEEEKPKRATKDPLSLSVSPAQPQAQFQFMVNASGLDPLQSATLEMFDPSGGSTAATVKAGPEGTAQWIMLAREGGEHDLEVTAEGKRTAEETIDVLP